MRVLFTAAAGVGHVFPLVPLAWAMRAAGHDVLLVTAGRGLHGAAGSGLAVADYAPDQTSDEISDEITSSFPSHLPASTSRVRNLAEVAERVCRIADHGIDETVRIGLGWRPDIVVHDPLNAAGLVIADKLAVPAVQHVMGFARCAGLSAELYSWLRDSFDRHGTKLPDTQIVLDIAPPSMLTGAPEGWSIRPVPHDGGGVLPDWLRTGGERRTVAVTLGTVNPHENGLGSLGATIEAAADVDADFVFALGGGDTGELGKLPPNVRAEPWLPFGALLDRSSLAVHHGGAGATMASLAKGVPQLVLPNGADRHANAEAVAERGAGLVSAPADVTAELLTRLLNDEPARETARDVREEIRDMPSPGAVAARLEAFLR